MMETTFFKRDRLERIHGSFPEPDIFNTRGDPSVFEFQIVV